MTTSPKAVKFAKTLWKLLSKVEGKKKSDDEDDGFAFVKLKKLHSMWLINKKDEKIIKTKTPAPTNDDAEI